MKWLEGGGVDSPGGVSAVGLACGIKGDGALDLTVVKAEDVFSVAGVFTTNAVKAAPVLYDMDVLARNPDRIAGVVVNSGCANACTGSPGLENAEATAREASERLGGGKEADYLVMSTGVIGVQLPMDKLAGGLADAANADWANGDGLLAAQAIMTTDTVPKHCALEVELSDGAVTIGGMAKGAGMIHPNMATMLAFITTDAALDAAVLQPILARAVDASFNRISVDGDTSTNDTVLLMANGASDVTPKGADLEAFEAGLLAVCQRLAQAIVRDGEGATKFISVRVTGARDEREAHCVANTIATSPLVKTAFYGEDANWGRILAAAGRSGMDLDPDRMALWFDDLQLVSDGAPTDYAEADAAAIVARDEIDIRLELGLGQSETTVWTCDLSHDYVTINGQYRT
jgi:glutamate N-acetyltransferase/amino-acid N-acetyltransferase